MARTRQEKESRAISYASELTPSDSVKSQKPARLRGAAKNFRTVPRPSDLSNLSGTTPDPYESDSPVLLIATRRRKLHITQSEHAAIQIAHGANELAERLPESITLAQACTIIGISYAETIDGRPHHDWVPGTASPKTVQKLAREGKIVSLGRGLYLRDSVIDYRKLSALQKRRLQDNGSMSAVSTLRFRVNGNVNYSAVLVPCAAR